MEQCEKGHGICQLCHLCHSCVGLGSSSPCIDVIQQAAEDEVAASIERMATKGVASCRMGHDICGNCGECHHCWGMADKTCEQMAVALAAEMVEMDVASLGHELREQAVDKMHTRRLQIEGKGGEMGKKDDKKVDAFDIYLQSECEWSDKDRCFVTKIGGYRVMWDRNINGYRLESAFDKDGKVVRTYGGDHTTTHYGTTYRNCKHDGRTEVINIGGVSFRAAKGWDIDAFATDLIIDCGNTQATSQFVYGASPFKELNDFAKLTQVVKLDWKDQAPPPVGLQFWREFWLRLVALKPIRVTICCVGGHGRTGTCLASLIIASGAMTDLVEVVEHIRKIHCKEAIETKSQMNYLVLLAAASAEAIEEKKFAAAQVIEPPVATPGKVINIQ